MQLNNNLIINKINNKTKAFIIYNIKRFNLNYTLMF